MFSNHLIHRLCVCLLMLLFAGNVVAQNQDSLHLVTGAWKCDTLSEGVVLKCLTVSNNALFSSNQNISILEINPETAHCYYAIAAGSNHVLKRTSDFCKESRAFAAINGTFFFMKSGISTDYVKINYQKIADNAPKAGKRKSYKNGLLALDSNQFFIIMPDTNLFFEDSLLYPNIMTSGPMLLYGGCRLPFIQNSFTLDRHNRTGVALMKDGKICWVVVDGRFNQAAGMSLNEFANMMMWLGAVDMLNLDGGGSSTLFINKPQYQIVNFPSDNGRFDKNGERKVANALLLFITSQN